MTNEAGARALARERDRLQFALASAAVTLVFVALLVAPRSARACFRSADTTERPGDPDNWSRPPAGTESAK